MRLKDFLSIFRGTVPTVTIDIETLNEIDENELLIRRPTMQEYAAEYTKWPERILFPLMEAGIDAYSLFFLIAVIAEGYPNHTIDIIRFAARYLVLPTALTSALNKILEQKEFQFTIVPHHIAKSATNGINLSSFLIQFAFFSITEIIRALEHKSPDEQVDIKDWIAWSTIGACSAIGVLELTRTYYQLVAQRKPLIRPVLFIQGFTPSKEEDFQIYPQNFPQQASITDQPSENKNSCITTSWQFTRNFFSTLHGYLKQVATHKASQRILPFLSGASTFHLLFEELEQLFSLSYNGIWEQIARYGSSAGAGLIAAMALGGPTHPSLMPSNMTAAEKCKRKWLQGIDFSFFLTRFVAVGLLSYQTFSDPSAERKLGKNTIEEQEYFWAALPAFIILAQFASQALYNYIDTYFAEADFAANINPDISEDEEAQPTKPNNTVETGEISAIAALSSSSNASTSSTSSVIEDEQTHLLSAKNNVKKVSYSSVNRELYQRLSQCGELDEDALKFILDSEMDDEGTDYIIEEAPNQPTFLNQFSQLKVSRHNETLSSFEQPINKEKDIKEDKKNNKKRYG